MVFNGNNLLLIANQLMIAGHNGVDDTKDQEINI